ncbi:MAG: [FeFe] hydrogenase H-cluster radical SAM maturase HydG [Omnitrophica bacterium RIFCSPLOWO2_01_FULL_45_24]|nr:MAG: [FeFe] hydrogenase H-cluster radical SAM maturase HydG [Omnitrophica bacterium RIFCSPHIGHO2_02_FULL_46_20]OGW94821.1 MAG: [FeFe] hydrogenase H-cluster radical SAM maturase HydG [Omnitrophica bacterium RIFCSPLOWO2_01_FULL_45_24]
MDTRKIEGILKKRARSSKEDCRAALKKARAKTGLDLDEAAILINLKGGPLTKELLDTALWVKNEIYGERIVFFAPLYVSDFCVNDCGYCNFHRSNTALSRRRLSLDEVEGQVRLLIEMGHKRLLVESGEDPENNTIDYIAKVIDRIYSVRAGKGNIRRVNVNIAATTVENYRKLKKAGIGTYQLFQETYHRPTYGKLHDGPKSDYDRQITAYERAFSAGIDDLGLGVLFGLYDWRFEVMSLIAHSQYLDSMHKVGPHTISVPRFRPAPSVTYRAGYPVSDGDFLKLVALLRLAVPYAGMIISTRESPAIRKKAFLSGISQASASSAASVGGYKDKRRARAQFAICDERGLDSVIKSVLDDRILPSFCTACYRTGRTGEAFMELSKPGHIHNLCRPNGILTFAEYLEDFASSDTYKKGYEVLNFHLARIDGEPLRARTRQRLARIKKGARDLYF